MEVGAEVAGVEGARLVEGRRDDILGGEAVDVGPLEQLGIVAGIEEAAVEPEEGQRQEEGRHEEDAHENEGYPAESRHVKAPS